MLHVRQLWRALHAVPQLLLVQPEQLSYDVVYALALVLLLVVLDHVVWPQLGRTMVHPALVVFGILFVVQKQLPVGFVNPFDGRRLDDPLSLWHRLGLPIDPVKLYVGNVPGPIAAT